MISCEINNISSCSGGGTVNTFTFTCHRICCLSSLHGITYFVKMIIIIFNTCCKCCCYNGYPVANEILIFANLF